MSKKKYEIWCKSCGCLMTLRHGRHGKFWGCTGYPQCRATLSERDAALEEEGTDMDEPVRWDR